MAKPTADQLIVSNLEFRLPKDYDAEAYPRIPFNPKKIVHVRLSIDASNEGAPKELRFLSYETMSDLPPGDPFEEVEKFSQALNVPFSQTSAKARTPTSSWEALSPLDNPYDIPLTEPLTNGDQGFVVLQLDPAINWCFTLGGLGVTSKDFYSDDSFGVQFIDSDGTATARGVVAPLHSRILNFAYARRIYDTKQAFNFQISFVWMDGETEYKMPMVFDPDIPSSGGGSIP
jgi:hypothetical protein